jgi:hypothetical protein
MPEYQFCLIGSNLLEIRLMNNQPSPLPLHHRRPLLRSPTA